jgi:hypothetical protein
MKTTTQTVAYDVEKLASNYNAAKPNECLQEILNTFDYANMDGSEWERYNKFLDELDSTGAGWFGGKDLDFVQYRAKPIIVEAYPGMMNSPKKMTGIEVFLDKGPLIEKTKIAIKHTRTMNPQINNATAPNWGRYFLLKKA